MEPPQAVATGKSSGVFGVPTSTLVHAGIEAAVITGVYVSLNRKTNSNLNEIERLQQSVATLKRVVEAQTQVIHKHEAVLQQMSRMLPARPPATGAPTSVPRQPNAGTTNVPQPLPVTEIDPQQTQPVTEIVEEEVDDQTLDALLGMEGFSSSSKNSTESI